MSRLEQELQKATTSEFLLNAENERLKASQVLVEDQLEKAHSLLAEAEAAWAAAAVKALDKTSAMVKLQQDYEVEFACSSEKKELLLCIMSELASRSASKMAMESKRKLYKGEIKGRK